MTDEVRAMVYAARRAGWVLRHVRQAILELGCHVLGHGASVGEAGGDEAVGMILDSSDGALHEGRIANALGVGRRLVVVIEDPAVVLVDDVNLVAF